MRRALLLCLVGGLFACPTANAAIIIDIDGTTLAPGGGGSIDVMISGDSLAAFNFEFKISRVTGTGQLDFANPQSNAQLSDTSYVFYNNSYDLSSNSGGVGNVTSTDVFTGADLTNALSNVTLSATRSLFARLDLTSDGATPTQAGDEFRIDLVSGLDTSFYSADYFNDPFNTSPISYTSNFGTITISGANAVPEPGTFGMMLFGGFGLSWAKRRRRRR